MIVSLDRDVIRLEVPPLPGGRPNVLLIGPMGSGKTATGRALAARIGFQFIDTDAVIERRTGRSVSEIFAVDGEDAFRALEREVLRDLRTVSGAVIATGGGAVLHDDAINALRKHAVVASLRCDPEVAVLRMPANDRPLLAGTDAMQSLKSIVANRARLYAAADITVDTSRCDIDAVCNAVAPVIPAGPATISVEATERYPILIGPGTCGRLGAVLTQQVPGVARALIVMDDHVPAHFASAIAKQTPSLPGGATTIRITGGEEAKNVDVLARLWSACAKAKLTRNDVIIAVGGGAVLDVAGFAAATFARGVSIINIPTTMLAMADAAIGGKNGINHDGFKNIAGTTHQPVAVICDTSALQDAPARVIHEGLAEIIKAGALASPLLLDVIADASMDWMLEQAVRIKAGYVAADPDDRDIRQSLNLGHTFAHAIESASDYAITHGDAVAAGLEAACRLGESLGITPATVSSSIRAALRSLDFQTAIDGNLSRTRMAQAMMRDKKRRDGVRFIVPARDGVAVIGGIEPADALSSLEKR